jgi:phosphatidylserine decarboxylase
MGIDKAGWPFILGALVIALAMGWWLGRLWSIPLVVVAAFFVFFFRDPDRRVPTDPDLVLAPADGKVMFVGPPPFPGAPPGEWQLISIFLSPLDVHVNRTPVEGRVARVEYHPGKFLPAYRVDAGTHNEWTEVWFERGGTQMVLRQIVGILARRIVCRVKPGETVERGQRFGIMKFGSRIDLFLPPAATIRVKVGDRVVGGESALALLTAQTIAAPRSSMVP